MPRYFVDFWHRLASPEWAADTGLPLLVTVLAIVGALYGVRRQIRHDRELAVIPRRVEFAAEVAIAISECLDRFHPEAVLREEDWPGVRKLFDVLRRSRNRSGEFNLYFPVHDLALYANRDWRACHGMLRTHLDRPTQTKHITDRQLDDAITLAMEQHLDTFKTTAEFLRDWNGIDPIPGEDPIWKYRDPAQILRSRLKSLGVVFPEDETAPSAKSGQVTS